MIEENDPNKMFILAGINKAKLHETLRELGRPPKKAKDQWTPQRPTTGYCHAVTEVVSYVLKKSKVPHKTFRLDMGNGDSHWFIRLGQEGNGKIIDLTADQQDDPFDYEKAESRRPQTNQYMKKYGLSKGAEAIARMMQLL